MIPAKRTRPGKTQAPHQDEAFSPSPQISTAGLALYRGRLERFECEEDRTFYTSDLRPDLKLLQREGQILSVLSAVVGNAAGTAGEAAKSTEEHEISAYRTTFYLEGELFFSEQSFGKVHQCRELGLSGQSGRCL